MTEPRLMTIRTAMARYAICRTTLYKHIRAGRLSLIKIGGSSRLIIAEADAAFMGMTKGERQ